jgi:hypothetical protein
VIDPAPRAAPSAGSRRDSAVFLAGIAVMSLAWLYLQRGALAVLPGDEAIYLYGGKLLADGFQPYRDFFLAHPPMRVVVAALFHAAGAPPAVLKAFLLLLVPLGAWMCGRAVLRPRGPAWALVAAFLYLFATLNLDLGGVLLGPELALPLLAGSMLAASAGRFALSGALVGLAGLQAVYALLPAPALAAWAWRERRLRRFLAGSSTLLAGYTACFAAWGRPFLDQVLLYHVAKVSGGDRPLALGRVAQFAYTEAGLLAFPLATLLARERTGRWTSLAGLSCVAVAATYRALFVHYFALALPFLAAGAALGLAALRERLAQRPGLVRSAAIPLVVAALVVTHLPHVLYAVDLDADRAVRARDAAAIADAVARTPPASGLLWGDSALVPLVALRTGLDVALRMPDTNDQRFTSGLADPSEVAASLSALPPPGVLLIDDHGIARVPELRAWVESRQKQVFEAALPSTGWKCRYYLGAGDADRGRTSP